MVKVKKSKRLKSTIRKVPPVTAAPVTTSFNPYNSAFYALVLGIALTGGWYFWQAQVGEAEFAELAASYTGSQNQVRTMRNLGGGHLTPGQSFRYSDTFPTSGIHNAVWTKAGIYTNPQPDTQLVHALEHGNIVIYYDQPADDVTATLESWSNLYGSRWAGIVMTRRFGLEQEVVLTAWNKMLRLKTFDAAEAASFIDTYRGRGPENPVR